MLAATSNTLPDRLGEDRFAAADFLREIQGLAAHFDVVRIDGEDYRHRGLPDGADRPLDAREVTDAGCGVPRLRQPSTTSTRCSRTWRPCTPAATARWSTASTWSAWRGCTP